MTTPEIKDLYGIIGYPLKVTASPAFFNKKFADEGINAVYEPFAIEDVNELKTILQAQAHLKGLNVTIPHKRTVIPLLDSIDAGAASIGAVNCIAIKEGKTKGYNTDAIGFEESLKPLLQPQHKHALVLGTGGASKAVCYVLGKLSIPFKLVSRSKNDDGLLYEELSKEVINAHTLIINTTPLGMSPNVDDAAPIPYEWLTPAHLLYDLIYSPEETKFLRLGKERGATIKNGKEMFLLQAQAAWKIWNS